MEANMKKFLIWPLLALFGVLIVANLICLIQSSVPCAYALQCASPEYNGRITWVGMPPQMLCVCSPSYRECCCGPWQSL